VNDSRILAARCDSLHDYGSEATVAWNVTPSQQNLVINESRKVQVFYETSTSTKSWPPVIASAAASGCILTGSLTVYTRHSSRHQQVLLVEQLLCPSHLEGRTQCTLCWHVGTVRLGNACVSITQLPTGQLNPKVAKGKRSDSIKRD
jgi:hypothetical protein